MYIIIHENAGKTIITDEMTRTFEEYKLPGMKMEYNDDSIIQKFPLSNNSINVYRTHAIAEQMETYCSDKLSIIAAGGLVYNIEHKLLMIFRKGMWDMPKGKLDEGETIEQCAIREVQEETGLSSIILKKKLTITYHTYHLGDHIIIKPSHWYEMEYHAKENPKPQLEEDITEIRWVAKSEATELLSQMFPSIQELVSRYFLQEKD